MTAFDDPVRTQCYKGRYKVSGLPLYAPPKGVRSVQG